MAHQILSSDKILRVNNYSLLGLVQSSDLAPNFGAQDINELGRISRVDTAYELETSGSFNVESSGNTAGLLARMLPVRSAGAFQKFLYSGAGAGTNKNAYTITQNDVSELQFDIVQYEKPDQINFTRAVVVPRAFPASITGRLDANGMGSETVNWQAQEMYGFDTPYHDVVITAATRTSANTATVLDTSVTATNYTLIYAWIDEKRFRTVNTDDAYVSFATTIMTFTGDTIPTGAIVRAVFYKTTSPSNTFPVLASASRGTVAFYIKGWQADLYLGVANADSAQQSERLLKVQSADWGLDFNLQPLRQILKNTAGTAVYCRVPTTPYNISLTCSLYESDWSEWRKILNADGVGTPKFPTTGNDVYTDSYDWAPVNLKGDVDNAPLMAVLKYYTKAGNLLQTMKFKDLRIDTQSDRVNVGGRAEIQLGFRGTTFEVVGANPTS